MQFWGTSFVSATFLCSTIIQKQLLFYFAAFIWKLQLLVALDTEFNNGENNQQRNCDIDLVLNPRETIHWLHWKVNYVKLLNHLSNIKLMQ